MGLGACSAVPLSFHRLATANSLSFSRPPCSLVLPFAESKSPVVPLSFEPSFLSLQSLPKPSGSGGGWEPGGPPKTQSTQLASASMALRAWTAPMDEPRQASLDAICIQRTVVRAKFARRVVKYGVSLSTLK